MLTKKILSFGRYIRRAYIAGADRKTVLSRLRVGGAIESVGETMFPKGLITIPKRDDLALTIYPGAYEVNQKHLVLHSTTDLYKLFYSRYANPDDVFIRSRNFNQRMTVPNTIAYGEFDGHGTPLSKEMYMLFSSIDTDAYPADIPEFDGAGMRYVNSVVKEVKLADGKSEGYKVQIKPKEPKPDGTLYEYLARLRFLPDASGIFPELDITGQVTTGEANQLPIDPVSPEVIKFYDSMAMLEARKKLVLAVGVLADPKVNEFDIEKRSQFELNEEGKGIFRIGKAFEIIADKFKGGSNDREDWGHDIESAKLSIESDGKTRFENTKEYQNIIYKHPEPLSRLSGLEESRNDEGLEDYVMPKNIDNLKAKYTVDDQGKALLQLISEYMMTIDGDPNKLPEVEDKPASRLKIDKTGTALLHLIKEYLLAVDPDPYNLEGDPASKLTIDNTGTAKYELKKEFEVNVDKGTYIIKSSTDTNKIEVISGSTTLTLHKSGNVDVMAGSNKVNITADTLVVNGKATISETLEVAKTISAALTISSGVTFVAPGGDWHYESSTSHAPHGG